MIQCTFEDGNQASLRHITVGTVVVKDGKVLLVRRHPKLLEGGKWDIPGGYMDRDETLAEAAAREVYEESGWEIEKLNMLTIRDNPDRPREDRQNVAFVFFATATKQTGQPDWETTEQQWFDLENLPPEADIAFDHPADLALYKRVLKEKLRLPIHAQLVR